MSAVQPVPQATAPPGMNPPTGPYPQMYSGPQPAQVIYVQTTEPSMPRTYEKYASQSSRFWGIARISIGILSIILAIAAIVVDIEERPYPITTSVSGVGIWCGLFFVLSGSFGVAAASQRTVCPIVTNMVLAIVSASIFGMTYLCVSAAGAGMAADYRSGGGYRTYYGTDAVYHGYSPNRADHSSNKASRALVGLFSVMTILAFAEIVADIRSSVICCQALCCGYTPPPQQMQFMQSQPGQQVMYINNANNAQTTTAPFPPVAGYQYPSIQGEPQATRSGGDSPPPAYAPQAYEPKQGPPAHTN